MVSDKDIRELVSYEGSDLLLSVYLDTDLSAKPRDAVKLDLRQSLKELAVSPDEHAVDAITQYLDYEYTWQSRGLALFAVEGRLWKVITLPVAVPAHSSLAKYPYVRPLVDFRDRYGDYNVAIIDRESVRLFSVSGGKINSETEAYGEGLKRHKQGGWAAARYQRHEDNIVLHNLKQTIELIDAFSADSGYAHLILGGNNEILNQMQGMLPAALRNKVVAEFPADIRISQQEILAITQELLALSDREREEHLVNDTITAASKGGAGVRGLADSLYTLREGRARQLLISTYLESAGYECAHCRYLAVESFTTCPFCGEKDVQAVPDVVNEAVVNALKAEVAVNVIRDNRILDDSGGIAAVLRY
ncbi:MAG: hypothetical protein LLG44_12805 [Chloroflexi bacterium]|nr:hypothetical protein [Chloroflexota bacterium]